MGRRHKLHRLEVSSYFYDSVHGRYTYRGVLIRKNVSDIKSFKWYVNQDSKFKYRDKTLKGLCKALDKALEAPSVKFILEDSCVKARLPSMPILHGNLF